MTIQSPAGDRPRPNNQAPDARADAEHKPWTGHQLPPVPDPDMPAEAAAEPVLITWRDVWHVIVTKVRRCR